MVIVNDFEFQIVSAEDKIPFKEHTKGGNTYVEVEPDAEYFLSITKITSETRQRCMYCVDGINLQVAQTYDHRSSEAYYIGIFTRSEGFAQMKALKFVKASFVSTDEASGATTMAGMGKVELVVHDAIFTGRQKALGTKASRPTFSAPTIKTTNEASVSMKKDLRSGEGHHVESEAYDENDVEDIYATGDYLYTITLHYCATPGLIAVGVLPKPPLWDYHRMLKPSKTTAEEKAKLDKLVRSVKCTRNGSEILELGDSDDDGAESDVDDSKQANDVLYVGDVDPNQRRSKRPRETLSSSTR